MGIGFFEIVFEQTGEFDLGRLNTRIKIKTELTREGQFMKNNSELLQTKSKPQFQMKC